MSTETYTLEETYAERAREIFGTRWDECISCFPEKDRGSVAGYVWDQARGGNEKFTLLPTVEDFIHLYCGEWDSFQEFACDHLLDAGVSSDALEYLGCYFDFARYAYDLSDEYYIVDTGRGTVWVYAVWW